LKKYKRLTNHKWEPEEEFGFIEETNNDYENERQMEDAGEGSHAGFYLVIGALILLGIIFYKVII
jgi:hypothetical protein